MSTGRVTTSEPRGATINVLPSGERRKRSILPSVRAQRWGSPNPSARIHQMTPDLGPDALNAMWLPSDDQAGSRVVSFVKECRVRDWRSRL